MDQAEQLLQQEDTQHFEQQLELENGIHQTQPEQRAASRLCTAAFMLSWHVPLMLIRIICCLSCFTHINYAVIIGNYGANVLPAFFEPVLYCLLCSIVVFIFELAMTIFYLTGSSSKWSILADGTLKFLFYDGTAATLLFSAIISLYGVLGIGGGSPPTSPSSLSSSALSRGTSYSQINAYIEFGLINALCLTMETYFNFLWLYRGDELSPSSEACPQDPVATSVPTELQAQALDAQV